MKRLLFPAIMLLTTAAAVANPIEIPERPFLVLVPTVHNPFPWIAFLALGVEYLIIRYAFREFLTWKQSLVAFLLIHLVTFPLTTLLATIFTWRAEVLPLVTEPIFFTLAMRYYGKWMPPEWLIPSVVGANLASFLIGILLMPLVIWSMMPH